jgi:hypothetical protein
MRADIGAKKRRALPCKVTLQAKKPVAKRLLREGAFGYTGLSGDDRAEEAMLVQQTDSVNRARDRGVS